MQSSSSDFSSSGEEEFDGDDATWVEWFCSQKGNEFYVEVEEDYINDDFNLTGLHVFVPFYENALNLILDCEDDDDVDIDSISAVEAAAVKLYGLIHARYLLTTRGQQALLAKFKTGVYGTCPHEVCDQFKQKMLPVGSDLSSQSPTRAYCPCCNELYYPRNPKMELIDGAHFGSSASLILCMTNPQLAYSFQVNPGYEVKLFGFRAALPRQNKDVIRKALDDKSLATELGKPATETIPDSDST